MGTMKVLISVQCTFFSVNVATSINNATKQIMLTYFFKLGPVIVTLK